MFLWVDLLHFSEDIQTFAGPCISALTAVLGCYRNYPGRSCIPDNISAIVTDLWWSGVEPRGPSASLNNVNYKQTLQTQKYTAKQRSCTLDLLKEVVKLIKCSAFMVCQVSGSCWQHWIHFCSSNLWQFVSLLCSVALHFLSVTSCCIYCFSVSILSLPHNYQWNHLFNENAPALTGGFFMMKNWEWMLHRFPWEV